MSARDASRPLLTFAVLGYDQERFIDDAVHGALGQTYEPLEIVLSDDCSRDGTFDRMQRAADAYSGPHHLVPNRNPANLGIAGHVNRVMELARGELVVVAAGDDISLPERTERLWQTYVRSDGRALSIYSNERVIDERGRPLGLTRPSPPPPGSDSYDYYCTHEASVIGSSHCWHRSVFDVFGPLDSAVGNEDVVIPLRSLLLGEVRYVHEPLVLRRMHASNVALGTFRFRRLRSAAELRALERSRAIRRHHAYANKLRDLATYRTLPESERRDTARLAAAVNAWAKEAADSRAFWEAPPASKVRIAALGLLRPDGRRSASNDLLPWMFPRAALLARRSHTLLRRALRRLPHAS